MFKRTYRLVSSVFVAALVALAGCTDSPTSPDSPQLLGADGLLGNDGNVVSVIKRSTPLGSTLTATRTIGPSGGALAIPEAGIFVYFPPGAVDEPTEITITAPKGKLVGYHFAPHGLEFDAPVLAVQNLWGTSGFGQVGSLMAAYFEGPLKPRINALELLPVRSPGALGGLAVFNIEHFSGYVIATD